MMLRSTKVLKVMCNSNSYYLLLISSKYVTVTGRILHQFPPEFVFLESVSSIYLSKETWKKTCRLIMVIGVNLHNK